MTPYLMLRLGSSYSPVPQSVFIKNAHNFAVGVGGALDYTDGFNWLRLTTFAGGRISLCGEPNQTLPASNVPMPFAAKSSRNATSLCNRFYHCSPQGIRGGGIGQNGTNSTPYNGMVTVDYNTYPRNTNCSASVNQGLMTMLFADTDAVVGGSSYKYYYQVASSSAFSTTQAALAYLRDFHVLSSTAEIMNFEQFTVPGASSVAYMYTVSTADVTTSPIWRWPNPNRRYRSSSVWCSASHAPQFRLHHRTTPSGSSLYNCNLYASIFNISKVCMMDSTCIGYTIVQNSTTFDELPGCLVSAATGLVSDDLTTYAQKNTYAPTCTIPVSNGKSVSVKVTSAVATPTVYKVYADSILIGNCTGLSSSGSNPTSCTQLYDCWAGTVPEFTSDIRVVAEASSGFPDSRCGNLFMGVVVTFDLTSTYYEPASSCLAPLDLVTASGCAATSVSAQCALGSRIVQNLSYPTSACSATDSTETTVFADITPTSTTAVGLLVSVDLSSMSTSLVGAALVEILVHTSGGVVEPIGFVQQNATSGAVSFFSVDDSPNSAYPTCTTPSEANANSIANAEFFAIPQALASKGIVRVEMRAPNARLISAYLVTDEACLPILYETSDDNYFATPGQEFSPTGPVISTTAMNTYGGCAALCMTEPKCFVFAFKAQSCILYNSLGTTVSYSPGTTVGTKPRDATVGTFYDTIAQPASNAASMAASFLQAAALFPTVVAFHTDLNTTTSKRVRLLLHNADKVQVAVGQSIFANGGFLAVGAVSSGGLSSCGSYYSPYVGGTTGSSSQCDTLRTCRALSFRSKIASHIVISPINVGVTPSCSTNLWGVVATSGTIADGVEFYRIVANDAGSTDNYAELSSSVIAPTIERFPSTVNGVDKRLVLYEDGNVAGNILSYTSINYCRISTRTIFPISNGTISPSSKYGCGTLASAIRDVMIACEADANCNGFTTDLSGSPLCYSRVNMANASLSSTTTDLFWSRVTKTSCTYTLSSPGQISISIAQLHLGQDYANDVKILNNGKVLYLCGKTNPFLSPSGFVSTNTSNCSQFLECFNGLVVESGTLEIVFPQPAGGSIPPYSCTDGGGATHFGAAIVDYYVALGNSRTFHAVAATFPSVRTISTTNQAFDFNFMVSEATSYAAEVRQDRYTCGVGCTIPFSLNVSLAERVRRCGGLAGFEDGTGLSDACRSFYYCGETTTASGSRVATTYPSAITGKLHVGMVNSLSLSTPYCGNTFNAYVYSNGPMIGADGVGTSSVRTFYAKSVSATTATLPTVASLKVNLTTFVDNAHPEMAPGNRASATVFNKVFPVTANLETSVSQAYIIYDFLGVEESLKSIHNGTIACTADGISVDGQTIRCRFVVNSNHITVRVAQTKFDSTDDFILLRTSQRTTYCGGDNDFFGLNGLLDKCGTYFTCYDGYITPGETVEIEFASTTIQKSRCSPGVMALIDANDAVVAGTLNCTSDLPLECPLANKCLSLDQICDRNTDCPDKSDEAKCSLWKTAGTQLVPTCAPKAFSASATTEIDCKRFAILEKTPTVLTYNSSGCAVYDCVTFANPQLQSLPAAASKSAETRMMVYTRDAFSFMYCTDDLQCNGNGQVSGSTTPCTCVCDENHVGMDCSALKRTDYSGNLVVAYPAGTTITSTITSPLLNTILNYLQASSTVAVRFVESSPAYTYVYLLTKDPSGEATSSYELNTLFYNSTYTKIMKVGSTNGGALFITSENSNSQIQSAACHINNFESSVTRTCSVALANVVADPHTLTVEIQGVQLSTDSQYVDVVLLDSTNTTIVSERCSRNNSVNTRDFTLNGDCSYLSSCTIYFNASSAPNVARVQTTLSSGLNSTGVVCNGYAGNVATRVAGRTTLTEDNTFTVPSSSTEKDAAYLYLFFAILAVGVIGLILFVTWFRLRSKHPKYFCLGPCLGGFSLFFVAIAFCALAFYLATNNDTYTHMIIVEDFRDELCSSSALASLPLSTSIAPANGRCHRAHSAGRVEGSLFIAASFGADKSGLAWIQVGASMEDCASSTRFTITLRTCSAENGFMPWKPQKDLSFLSFRGATNDVAARRLAETRANNPLTAPQVATVVASLPASQAYAANLPTSRTFVYDRDQSQTIRVPSPGEFLMVPVMNDTFLSFSLVSEVRFKETIHVGITLFTSGGDKYVDSLPIIADVSNVSKFYPYGGVFDAFDTDYVLNGLYGGSVTMAPTTASIYAYYFMDVPSSTLMLGEEFTLTLWVQMSRYYRGFIFATTDAWVTDSGTSPILSSLADIIESGGLDSGEIFLSGSLTDWTVYSALYISGYSREIYLLTATANDVVSYVRWSTEETGTNRLFNGGWHFLAITSAISGSSRDFQLYVDGESNPTKSAWVNCADFTFPSHKARSTGNSVYVTSDRDESVLPGTTLVVGQLEGGVFGIRLYADTVYFQEDIFLLGADGMDNYYPIAVAESYVIGVVTAILAGMMVLYSLYHAFRREFGVNEDEFEDEAVYDERGRKIYTEKKTQSKSSAYTSSVRVSAFVEPFLLLLQVITLFITMWRWPTDYTDYFAPIAFVSFDLNYFLPGIPLVTWVLITYASAVALFILFVVITVRDTAVFEVVVERYKEMIRIRAEKENRGKKKITDDDLFMLDLPKPNYKWVVHAKKGGTRNLTKEEEDTLVENLKEICTARARRETNMRVFTKSLVNMGDEFGEGIILYERLQGRIFISFRTSLNDLEHDQQSTQIDVKQTYFELTCENISCPEHKGRLLPEDIHNAHCVHSTNPYYRSKECPTNCIMYLCPEDGCDYAVCEHCYGGGALGGGVADAMQKLKSARKKGLNQMLGSFFMLLTSVVYMPTIKYALMIVSCHETYRCEFDGCWSSPTALYLGMVALSILVLVCIGIGFIFLQFNVLLPRRKIMSEILPLQTRRHGGTHNRLVAMFLSKRTVLREDYLDFLGLDTTITGAIYSPYEYDFWATSPLLLFYRLALTAFVVLVPPNTLFQLGAATLVSLIFCFLLMIVSPYLNVWIELLVRLGAFHNLVELALMSLHRVNIRSDPTGGGFSAQMVAVTFIYIGVVGLLLIITVLVPFVRKLWTAKERRDREATAREEETFDIGFWGETNAGGHKATY